MELQICIQNEGVLRILQREGDSTTLVNNCLIYSDNNASTLENTLKVSKCVGAYSLITIPLRGSLNLVSNVLICGEWVPHSGYNRDFSGENLTQLPTNRCQVRRVAGG